MVLLNDFTTTVRKAFDEIDPNWETYDGLIVCGNHNTKTDAEMNKYLEAIKEARENDTPFLGICAGLQFAAMEYSKNVLGGGTDVLDELPSLNVGLKDGETYWNYYVVKPEILAKMRTDLFSPRFVAVQYHPEYQSSKDKPHQLLVNFINECKKK